ncbi:MAG: hypothetical protein KAG53_07295 [Endozoicomonadaceae bacterium]|nr:hypothetical protein [Endozoicomonadaceae bacterium]
MPSRLLLLMHFLGGTPISNCKSGKDRIGMLDVDTKLLAICCEWYGEVLEPSA